MRDFVFVINKLNADQLFIEYSINDNDREYIAEHYWPIILLSSLTEGDIKKELANRRSQFIQENGIFEAEIFRREELELLIQELNQYLEAIKKGKSAVYGYYNEKYFHQFELPIDKGNTKTLLITHLDTIALEIHFKSLLKVISDPLHPSENIKGLSLRQIALIHYYRGEHITRDNAVAVAEENGFSSKTSGEALYQKFSSYCSNADRKALPDTKKKIENKILLFESILEYLSGNEKTKAIDELKIIKSKSEDL